jgi:hypothetical protein
MPVHFDNDFIKWTYRMETRDKDDPSASVLSQWEQTLHNRYAAFLTSEMQRAGIPNTRTNRSILALLIMATKGRGQLKVRNACEYFNNVSGIQV